MRSTLLLGEGELVVTPDPATVVAEAADIDLYEPHPYTALDALALRITDHLNERTLARVQRAHLTRPFAPQTLRALIEHPTVASVSTVTDWRGPSRTLVLDPSVRVQRTRDAILRAAARAPRVSVLDTAGIRELTRSLIASRILQVEPLFRSTPKRRSQLLFADGPVTGGPMFVDSPAQLLEAIAHHLGVPTGGDHFRWRIAAACAERMQVIELQRAATASWTVADEQPSDRELLLGRRLRITHTPVYSGMLDLWVIRARPEQPVPVATGLGSVHVIEAGQTDGELITALYRAGALTGLAGDAILRASGGTPPDERV